MDIRRIWFGKQTVRLALKGFTFLLAIILTFAAYLGFTAAPVPKSELGILLATGVIATAEVTGYYLFKHRLHMGSWPTTVDRILGIVISHKIRIFALGFVVTGGGILLNELIALLYVLYLSPGPSPTLACFEAATAENATQFSALPESVKPAVRKAIQADGETVSIAETHAADLPQRINVEYQNTTYYCQKNNYP